jgi:hypothetical protein
VAVGWKKCEGVASKALRNAAMKALGDPYPATAEAVLTDAPAATCSSPRSSIRC